jgi:hypothetical protein
MAGEIAGMSFVARPSAQMRRSLPGSWLLFSLQAKKTKDEQAEEDAYGQEWVFSEFGPTALCGNSAPQFHQQCGVVWRSTALAYQLCEI